MLRPRPRTLWGVGVPIALITILLAAWAIDAGASGGRVIRNVQLEGHDVGRMREDRLTAVVREVAVDYTSTPVEIRTTGHTYRSNAGEIGLSVDEPATVMAALDVGRTESVPVRPLSWIASFIHRREAPLRFKVDNDRLALVLIALQGGIDGRQPIEPTIRGTGDTVGIAGGQSGFALDSREVARLLVQAAEADRRPLTVRTEPVEQPPTFSDDAARRLADEMTAKTAKPLLVQAGLVRAAIPVATVRSWLGSQPGTDGLEVTLHEEKVVADLTASLAGLERPAKDASITLGPAGPVITPSQTAVRCCGEATAPRVLEAITAARSMVVVPVIEEEPPFTTAEAEALGIKEPVGTTVEWKGVQQVKSFTTYHACCESRVTNIHRLADLVRGAIIPPGKSFSINEHVGPRTTEKGFVLAGAIANGEHSEEVGGGVSQFATTLFNAAFFAGLDFGEYQSHSILFDRYPRGREATMGYEHPDLQIENNTPYGVMIWTSYTGTSLTVTLYSTQWVYGQQTGQSDSAQGNCTRVTTTRTRTYNDGHTDQDEVFAVYRPDFGVQC